MTQIKFLIDVKHVQQETIPFEVGGHTQSDALKMAKDFALSLKTDINHHIEQITIKDANTGKIEASMIEILDTQSEQNKESKAREILRELGFAVDNLWHTLDVTTKYNCTKQQALTIINNALTNEATIEQIRLAIDSEAEYLNIEKNII